MARTESQKEMLTNASSELRNRFANFLTSDKNNRLTQGKEIIFSYNPQTECITLIFPDEMGEKSCKAVVKGFRTEIGRWSRKTVLGEGCVKQGLVLKLEYCTKSSRPDELKEINPEVDKEVVGLLYSNLCNGGYIQDVRLRNCKDYEEQLYAIRLAVYFELTDDLELALLAAQDSKIREKAADDIASSVNRFIMRESKDISNIEDMLKRLRDPEEVLELCLVHGFRPERGAQIRAFNNIKSVSVGGNNYCSSRQVWNRMIKLEKVIGGYKVAKADVEQESLERSVLEKIKKLEGVMAKGLKEEQRHAYFNLLSEKIYSKYHYHVMEEESKLSKKKNQLKPGLLALHLNLHENAVEFFCSNDAKLGGLQGELVGLEKLYWEKIQEEVNEKQKARKNQQRDEKCKNASVLNGPDFDSDGEDPGIDTFSHEVDELYCTTNEIKKAAKQRLERDALKQEKHDGRSGGLEASKVLATDELPAECGSMRQQSPQFFLKYGDNQRVELLASPLLSSSDSLFITHSFDCVVGLNGYDQGEIEQFRNTISRGKIIKQDSQGQAGLKMFGNGGFIAVKLMKKGDRLICYRHKVVATDESSLYLYVPMEVVDHKKYEQYCRNPAEVSTQLVDVGVEMKPAADAAGLGGGMSSGIASGGVASSPGRTPATFFVGSSGASHRDEVNSGSALGLRH